MVVLDKTLKTPANPEKGWGVTPRKLTFQDFHFTLGAFAFVTLGGCIAFIPVLASFSFGASHLSDLGFFIMIFSGLFFLGTLGCALGNPKGEAAAISRRRSLEWQNDVLKPYLSKKYGIRFMRSGTSFFSGWNYTQVVYQNRTIEIKLHGVHVERDYRYGESQSFQNYTIDKYEGIWLEEVIRPASVSYRRMEPVA